MIEPPARQPLAANLAPLLREALERGESFRWPLRGASMSPTLPDACEIEVARLPVGPHAMLPLGALLVFATGSTLIAHRLVSRAGGRWVTQGDGCLAPDAPLSSEQILGVVTAAYRDGRRCWPRSAERALAAFWVARYYALRPIRFAGRRLRSLRGCG